MNIGTKVIVISVSKEEDLTIVGSIAKVTAIVGKLIICQTEEGIVFRSSETELSGIQIKKYGREDAVKDVKKEIKRFKEEKNEINNNIKFLEEQIKRLSFNSDEEYEAFTTKGMVKNIIEEIKGETNVN